MRNKAFSIRSERSSMDNGGNLKLIMPLAIVFFIGFIVGSFVSDDQDEVRLLKAKLTNLVDKQEHEKSEFKKQANKVQSDLYICENRIGRMKKSHEQEMRKCEKQKNGIFAQLSSLKKKITEFNSSAKRDKIKK